MTTFSKLLMIAVIPVVGYLNLNEGQAFMFGKALNPSLESGTGSLETPSHALNSLESVRVEKLFCAPRSLACFRGCGQPTHSLQHRNQQSFPTSCSHSGILHSDVMHSNVMHSDVMNTQGVRLIEYRRMFRQGQTPTAADLVGNWRGVNRGIVELVGYKQFIKEIKPGNCALTGDNIMVHQVSNELLRSFGWQVKADASSSDGLKRKGKFAIRDARGIGPFKHGVVFDYRQGNNRKTDPVRLIVDQVVKIDDNHLLGRATAKFGPIKIPLAYFVLERM